MNPNFKGKLFCFPGKPVINWLSGMYKFDTSTGMPVPDLKQALLISVAVLPVQLSQSESKFKREFHIQHLVADKSARKVPVFIPFLPFQDEKVVVRSLCCDYFPATCKKNIFNSIIDCIGLSSEQLKKAWEPGVNNPAAFWEKRQ